MRDITRTLLLDVLGHDIAGRRVERIRYKIGELSRVGNAHAETLYRILLHYLGKRNIEWRKRLRVKRLARHLFRGDVMRIHVMKEVRAHDQSIRSVGTHEILVWRMVEKSDRLAGNRLRDGNDENERHGRVNELERNVHVLYA